MSGPRSRRCWSAAAEPTVRSSALPSAMPRAIGFACGCMLALTAFALSDAPASAATAGLMRVGRKPSLPPEASILGGLPTAPRMHVTVGLNPRDPAALADYVRAVSTVGSSLYRVYLR